jgi:hypothetical protein
MFQYVTDGFIFKMGIEKEINKLYCLLMLVTCEFLPFVFHKP